MPYIFTDHDHASRVLEGEVGETLLAKLTDNSNVRGLAYTYSGGFRCLGVNKTVSALADLTGEKLRSNRNPVGRAVIRTMSGVEPFVCETEEAAHYVKSGECNGNDTVYSRIYPLGQNDVIQSVVDSKHSLFLTTIIIGTDVWDSLNAEDQAAMRQAALVSSRLERQWSIDDGIELATNTKQQKELGFSFSEFSDVETAKLKQRAEVVYDKYSQFFTPGLVDGIIKG
jgi:TRAP-type C4-dicarboxylate transport system substrate-binding protein